MLSEIVLTQVTDKSFEELHRLWYSILLTNNQSNDYVKILAPVNSTDYRTLIRDFLDADYSDRISVNNRGIWQKYYKRRTNKRDVNEISKIAKADGIKKGHLEFYFKKNRYSKEQTKIKFIELEGRIIGYEMLFSRTHAELFNLEGRFEFKWDKIYGLWSPDNAQC